MRKGRCPDNAQEIPSLDTIGYELASEKAKLSMVRSSGRPRRRR